MEFFRTLMLAMATMAAMALPLTGRAQPVAVETLEVVCSVHEWCALVQRAFTEATGVKVHITERGSGEALDLIVSERERPQHDLWFGGTGDFHLQAAGMRLTMAYRSPNNSLLHEWAVTPAQQSGYRTIGIYSGPLGFVYNPAALAAARLAPPRCWSDLVKPEYRNLVQMSSPYYSGTAYTVIATLVQLMGEDAAFTYLRKLDHNIKRYTHSGSDALANVARGDAAIVIAFVYGASDDAATSPALKTATPCEGTGYEVGSMSIIKGGPNPNAAKRFFDWALTAGAQDLAAQTRQFKLSSNRNGRVDGRIADPSTTRLIKYDFVTYGKPEERARLLKKWGAIVENAAKQ
ncbi:MAG: extracellular solute-binding protein [Pseudomonadota bacterium]